MGYRFWKKNDKVFIIIFFNIHNYTEYNQQWNVFSLFNPSKCTPGAVGTVHSGNAPARPPHVTLYQIHLFETR